VVIISLPEHHRLSMQWVRDKYNNIFCFTPCEASAKTGEGLHDFEFTTPISGKVTLQRRLHLNKNTSMK
jgi:hypothetical protein